MSGYLYAFMMYMDQRTAVFCFVVIAIVSLLGLVAWALGGGALLMVGGQFIAKCPKATFRRSVVAAFLAVLASDVLIALASALSLVLLGPLYLVGLLAGAAAGLLATWLIIKALFRVSFGRAILAWLPTLPLAVVALPAAGMLEMMLVPTISAASAEVDRAVCISNMRTIGSALVLYRAKNNKWPADLTALPAESVGSTKVFVCPCVLSIGDRYRPAGRTCDYFYCPPPSAAPKTIVACDFSGNHSGLKDSNSPRNVLCADGSVSPMSGAEFRAALADPANAAFFTALSQVEVWIRYPPPGGK